MNKTSRTHFKSKFLDHCQLAIITGFMVGSIASAIPATVVHQYAFDGSFDDSVGDITLTAGTPGLWSFSSSEPGLNLEANGGPTLEGAISNPREYSLEFAFSVSQDFFTATNPTTGDDALKLKLVDFKDGVSDRGLYIDSDLRLNFNNNRAAVSPVGSIAVDTPYHLVLTREDSSQDVTAYIDGIEQFSFRDSRSELAVISSVENAILFFQDDVATGGRESFATALLGLRIYEGVLTAMEVMSLAVGGGSFARAAVPVPPSWLLLLLPLWAVRRRT